MTNNLATILDQKGYPAQRLTRQTYKKIGINCRQFQRYIRNEAQPTLTEIEKICNLLDVSFNELFNMSEKERNTMKL